LRAFLIRKRNFGAKKRQNALNHSFFNEITSSIMRNYEVTFIVDPTLSSDEVSTTVQKYTDMLTAEGYTIVHSTEIGLRQLAYPINKRHSGLYFCIEFGGETGMSIDKTELALRRDEKVLRFLTVALDKYGVQYNSDKRAGKVGNRRAEALKAAKDKAEDAAELVLEDEGTAA
jgi:small subunit ribosomal protein S6